MRGLWFRFSELQLVMGYSLLEQRARTSLAPPAFFLLWALVKILPLLLLCVLFVLHSLLLLIKAQNAQAGAGPGSRWLQISPCLRVGVEHQGLQYLQVFRCFFAQSPRGEGGCPEQAVSAQHWGLLELPCGGFRAAQIIAGDVLGQGGWTGWPPGVPTQSLTLECGSEGAALSPYPHQLHLQGSVVPLKGKGWKDQKPPELSSSKLNQLPALFRVLMSLH